MSRNANQFVTLARIGPAKAPREARVAGFGEIYAPFAKAAGAAQSSRCAQCGVPFCQSALPAAQQHPRLAADDRRGPAARKPIELSAATSTMPEICGRICPQDRLCEGACVHRAVRLGHASPSARSSATSPTRPGRRAGSSRSRRRRERGPVGRASSAPAPRAWPRPTGCAADGYQVTVYDRHDRAGGLLIYGIPGFKLEKDVVERRTRRLAEGGVDFGMDFEVGRDATLDELRARHDAVLIATGVYKAARPDRARAAARRAWSPALDYLIASNRKGFGDAVPAFDDRRAGRRGQATWW